MGLGVRTVNRTRVLLADDHDEVLADIRDLLEPDFEIVAAVGDGCELVTASETLRPDVIVTDISMPKLSGLEAAWKITSENPAALVILLTAHRDPALVAKGLAAGAKGYVLKLTAGEELVYAIQQVVGGGCYVSPLAGL